MERSHANQGEERHQPVLTGPNSVDSVTSAWWSFRGKRRKPAQQESKPAEAVTIELYEPITVGNRVNEASRVESLSKQECKLG